MVIILGRPRRVLPPGGAQENPQGDGHGPRLWIIIHACYRDRQRCLIGAETTIANGVGRSLSCRRTSFQLLGRSVVCEGVLNIPIGRRLTEGAVSAVFGREGVYRQGVDFRIGIIA